MTPKKANRIVAAIAKNFNRVIQAKENDLIAKFGIQGLLPVSTVNLEAFRNLMQRMQPNRTVMHRSTLRTRIDSMMTQRKVQLTALLTQQKYVATTTECWSAFNKSYIGITYIHWIDHSTIQLSSACLALRRLKGHISFDIIARALEKVHKEFKIDGRILRTTTDSGLNFIEAITVFSDKTDDNDEVEEDSNDPDQEDDCIGIESVSVTDTLEQNQNSDKYLLP